MAMSAHCPRNAYGFLHLLHGTIYRTVLNLDDFKFMVKASCSYLDVDFDVESLCLAVSIADVEAEDILFGLNFVLAVLDVEDVV